MMKYPLIFFLLLSPLPSQNFETSQRKDMELSENVLAYEEKTYIQGKLIHKQIHVFDDLGFATYQIFKRFAKGIEKGLISYILSYVHHSNLKDSSTPKYYLSIDSVRNEYVIQTYEYDNRKLTNYKTFSNSKKIEDIYLLDYPDKNNQLKIDLISKEKTATLYRYKNGKLREIKTGKLDEDKSSLKNKKLTIYYYITQSLDYKEDIEDTFKIFQEERFSQLTEQGSLIFDPKDILSLNSLKEVTLKGNIRESKIYDAKKQLILQKYEILDHHQNPIEISQGNEKKIYKYFYKSDYNFKKIENYMIKEKYLSGFYEKSSFENTQNQLEELIEYINTGKMKKKRKRDPLLDALK